MEVRFPLSLKITFIFFFITIGGVLFASLTHYQVHKMTLFAVAKQDTAYVAKTKIRGLEGFLEQQKGRVIDFASDGYIRDTSQVILAGASEVATVQLHDHLVNNKLPINPALGAIAILGPEGEVISSTHMDLMGAFFGKEEWFVQAMNLNYATAVAGRAHLSDRYSPFSNVVVVAPLFDRSGTTRLGVLVDFVRFEALALPFLGQGEGLSPSVYPVTSSAIQLLFVDDRGEVSIAVHSESVPQLASMANVTGVCEDSQFVTDTQEGFTWSVACLDTGLLDWRVVAAVHESAFEPGLTSISRLTYLISGIVLLAVVLAYLVIRLMLLLPLRHLVQSMRDFRRLKRSISTLVGRHDEFGVLAQEFETMADRVDQALATERHLAAQKDVFLTIASHQLQTPLGGIRWGLEFLKANGNLSAPLLALVKEMEGSCLRLISLVADLLHVSRIDLRKNQVPKVKVSITEIIRSQINEVAPLAQMRGVSVQMSRVAKNPSEKIYLEPEKLRQVIQNLLTNAITYNKRGGSILVEVQKMGHHLLVRVADSGIGIPSNEQPRIFGRFYRASNAIRKEVLGSGLGLFIAKTYVEGWGGKIFFESTEGKGTTFTFTIPLKKSK